MTTRLEAAAEAICEWDNQYNWGSLGDESPMKALYQDAAALTLAASDAVLLDDATVERAAHVLYDHRDDALTCYDHDNGWCCICGEHDIDIPWFEHAARAVLAAAVKAGQ